MSGGQLPALLSHLRPWNLSAVAALSDAELLACFKAGGSTDAFTALMQRHGRMVWGICRHVLRHEQDAEDAFQATFLVLARKAGSIRKGTAVSSWLHSTAYHIATRARRNAAIRRKHERRAAAMPKKETDSDSSWREVLAILDEEVQRLPQKQRAAFVLCVQEGKSLAEAARQLGWKEGTLSGTLSRAREQLRLRLSRRGVALSAILTGLALCKESAARAALVEKTLCAALAFAEGHSAAGLVSASVAALVRAASRSVAGTALRLACLVMAATVAAGISGWAKQTPDASPEAKEQPASRNATQPRNEGSTQARTDRFGDLLPSGALARLGTVRLRTGGYRGPLAFSSDGKELISASSNGMVHYWETATGKPLRSFRTLSWAAADIKLSPDRKLLAASALFTPATLGLWDTATGKLIRRLEVPAGSKPFRLAFSPDGKTLVSGGGPDNKVCFWEVSTGRLLRELPLNTSIQVLDFSPDGKTLVTKTPGWVHLWDPANGEEHRRFQVSTNITPDYAFSPDSKILAASRLNALELWNPSTGEKLGALPDVDHHHAIALAFSPDGKILAAASFRTIRFWDVATRTEIAHTADPGLWVAFLQFTPNGKTVASRSDTDGGIRLWDVATGKELQHSPGHRSGVRDAVFSPDGMLLATHAGDFAVRVWRTATAEQQQMLPVDTTNPVISVASLCFAPDGKTLIFADRRGVVHVRDPNNGKEIHRFSLAENAQRNAEIYPGGLAVSGDGKILTVLAHHTIRQGNPAAPISSALTAAWNLATGEQVRRRDDKTMAKGIWTLSPDGKFWLANNQGALVSVYAVATGEHVLTIDSKCESVWPAVFSPDGRLLAGVCHHGKAKEGLDDYLSSIVLWELATGAEVRRIKLKPGSPEIAVAFSTDGRILASGGDESIGLQLWDLTTGEELHRYAAAGTTVRSLSFDAASRRLASGLADGTTLLWTPRHLTGVLARGQGN